MFKHLIIFCIFQVSKFDHSAIRQFRIKQSVAILHQTNKITFIFESIKFHTIKATFQGKSTTVL